jgi:hypothetical protein
MKGMTLVKAMMSNPEKLSWLEGLRKKCGNRQLEFIDEATPFFQRCLENVPLEPRRILLLFANYLELPFNAIVVYSRRPGNLTAVYLRRLKDAGLLEKTEQGDWRIINRDLQRYLVARYSGFRA